MALSAQGKLIWIDLEMTGLDTTRDQIIEIATVVTNNDLDVLAEGPVLAIHQSDDVLENMDDWNTRQHARSGLAERVRQSEITVQEAERQTLKFLRDHLNPNESPMCGNSICQDRRFLYRLMPELQSWFHYRNLDVSSLKELSRRWSPEILESLVKHNRHEALSDIRESIEELRHYRKFMGAFSGLKSASEYR